MVMWAEVDSATQSDRRFSAVNSRNMMVSIYWLACFIATGIKLRYVLLVVPYSAQINLYNETAEIQRVG